jgi:DNA-binding NtrC family response regulator
MLTPEAQQKLTSYPFPGNVRELKSIMELAVVMSDGENILPEHITLNASTSISDLLNRETTLKEFESQIIQHYLDKYDKDVLLVARKLDIGKSTIYRMIQNGELKSK